VDGKYTGELDFYAYGANKPIAIKELAAELDIDLNNSFAYSDSATDRPMLEAAGRPVAVNPDKELRRIALERDWRIETFRNPVSLRSRLPEWRRPEVTWASSVRIALAVVGMATFAWWVSRRSNRA